MGELELGDQRPNRDHGLENHGFENHGHEITDLGSRTGDHGHGIADMSSFGGIFGGICEKV